MCHVLIVSLFVINAYIVVLLLTPRFNDLLYNEYKYKYFIEN